MDILRELQYQDRCHWLMEFQKIGTFFWKNLLLELFCPQLPSNHFIDLANIVLATRGSVEIICLVSGSDSAHMDVTRPMNFEKNCELFFVKSCSRILRPLFAYPSTFNDFAKFALASKLSLKTMWTI